MLTGSQIKCDYNSFRSEIKFHILAHRSGFLVFLFDQFLVFSINISCETAGQTGWPWGENE